MDCYSLDQVGLVIIIVQCAILYVQLLRSFPYFCKRCNKRDNT
jgi:hypothetical protein